MAKKKTNKPSITTTTAQRKQAANAEMDNMLAADLMDRLQRTDVGSSWSKAQPEGGPPIINAMGGGSGTSVQQVGLIQDMFNPAPRRSSSDRNCADGSCSVSSAPATTTTTGGPAASNPPTIIGTPESLGADSAALQNYALRPGQEPGTRNSARGSIGANVASAQTQQNIAQQQNDMRLDNEESAALVGKTKSETAVNNATADLTADASGPGSMTNIQGMLTDVIESGVSPALFAAGATKTLGNTMNQPNESPVTGGEGEVEAQSKADRKRMQVGKRDVPQSDEEKMYRLGMGAYTARIVMTSEEMFDAMDPQKGVGMAVNPETGEEIVAGATVTDGLETEITRDFDSLIDSYEADGTLANVSWAEISSRAKGEFYPSLSQAAARRANQLNERKLAALDAFDPTGEYSAQERLNIESRTKKLVDVLYGEFEDRLSARAALIGGASRDTPRLGQPKPFVSQEPAAIEDRATRPYENQTPPVQRTPPGYRSPGT